MDQNDAVDFSIFDVPEGKSPMDLEAPATDGHVADVAAGDPPKVEEPVAKVETPKVEEPAQPEPKKHEPADDDLLAITVDGKVEYVRWGDYKGNVMRQADYTRKTTRVAERERELTEVAEKLQSREQSLIEIFSNRERLDALYDKLYPGQRTAQAAAPQSTVESPSADELVTHGDMSKAKGEFLTEAQKEAQRVVAMELQKVKDEQAALDQQKFTSSLISITETTLDSVLKAHAGVLGDIPHVDHLIKKLAAEEHPSTLDEVKTAIEKAAKTLADQFTARNREQKKADAVKQAELAKQGIETGGTPVGRERKSYEDKDGKVDWDSVDKDAVEWINSKLSR